MLAFIRNLFNSIRSRKVPPSRLHGNVAAFYKAGTMPKHLRSEEI